MHQLPDKNELINNYPQNHQRLSVALRRVLVLGELYKAALEWLCIDERNGRYYVTNRNNIINAIERLKTQGRIRALSNGHTDDNWQKINDEITSDNLQELITIIDMLVDCRNLDAVPDILKEVSVHV